MTDNGDYGDDLLVIRASESRVKDFFALLATLEIKDLVVVTKFLGMRIVRFLTAHMSSTKVR